MEEIRLSPLQKQKDQGIDLIPVGTLVVMTMSRYSCYVWSCTETI